MKEKRELAIDRPVFRVFQKNRRSIATVAAAVAVVAIVTTIVVMWPKKEVSTVQAETQIVSAGEIQRQRADQILAGAGWTPGTYKLTGIEVSQDTSTAGEGSFVQESIQTPEQMIAWLQSGSDAALTVEQHLAEVTGNSADQIHDPGNWVAVQSLVDFTYPGNTGFDGSNVVEAGSKAGTAGEIFLLYLPVVNAADNASQEEVAQATTDANAKAVAVRRACANPQMVLPTPVVDQPEETTTIPSESKPPTSGLTPKNPADDVTPPQGVTKLPAGEQTDGQRSAEQKKSGQTSGSVTDSTVGSGTTSGSTTPDTGSGVKVGGTGSVPSDDISDDVKDGNSTVYDDGGTSGNTQIADPG